VWLNVFGKVRLEGSGFSRPKPLLLLTYLALEGAKSRQHLAALFWGDPRAKSNLSVMLNQFKKEGAANAFPASPGLDPLETLVSCDAVEFETRLQQGKLEAALELYTGSFLHDLGKNLEDLEVSDELLDWVTLKREGFAQTAQTAMLTLADQHLPHDPDTARGWAERAYHLSDAPELEPAVTAHLQRLLTRTGSAHAKKLERSAKASLNDLEAKVRNVFLALSLQSTTNLAIVRNALELSLSELADAQETLFMLGLMDQKAQVLAPELAAHWLETHVKDRQPLLLNMARATPSAEAFALYQRVFAETQGFGGLGDVQRARTAYCAHAKTLMDRLEFKNVIALLEEVRNAERVMDVEPDAESVFLHAYALERSERFKDALEMVMALPTEHHDPNVSALRSVLLWRTGNLEEARGVARTVLKNSSVDWLWAQATAYCTMAYLSSSSGDFAEAVSNFKKSAECYEAAGDRQRWAGVLNNQAIELNRMAEHAGRLGEPVEVVEALLEKAETAYQQALEGLMRLEVRNKALEGRILLNLGKISETREDWVEAGRRYARAEEAIVGLPLHGLFARIRLNLGIVHRKRGLLSEAAALFRETITRALVAGEPQIQALAMNHLAILNNDVEQIELSLEMLQKAGGLDLMRIAIVDYGDILKQDAQQSLNIGNLEQTRRALERLQNLHRRLGHAGMAEKVGSAIQTIMEVAPPSIPFDLSDLFGELDFKEIARTA
jgi:tetratricopeptide (TPR) repeat protein